MNATVNAQNWLDSALYPFESKYIRLQIGKMHYVDEGSGDTILFIHGTPTWSFLYRDIIKSLSKSYRCISMDHIGFGLSDKPFNFTGTPQSHAQNLGEFIKKLNLNNITLVVHDFGGPIGLAAGIEKPENIRRVVLFNSWLWETKSQKEVQKIDKTLNSWLGKFLYLNMNFSPKVLLKQGFDDKKNLPKRVHKHYINPFPNKPSRMALLNIGKALAGSSDWYEQQWEQLDKLETKPWLILWGSKDKFISAQYLDKWKNRLPHATIKEFDCGHFVQEERTEGAVLAIENFMKK